MIVTAALVGRYADRFHRALVDGTHTVTSPLGAWLLLALVAPAATGATRDRLADFLGTDVDDAFTRACELLERPHPAVAAAAAVWAEPAAVGPAFAAWAGGLPPSVAAGAAPTQAEADAWAREHTLGLIDRFPGDVTAAVLLIATALATRVQWAVPFERVPAAQLGGRFADGVTTALRAPAAHEVGIARTEVAGDVAVHAARSGDGLVVVSAIAAPEVPPPDVLAAAHEVAPLALLRPSTATWRSLSDLPLGPGHAWTLREELVANPSDTAVVEAYLPAWAAGVRHDLSRAGVGCGEALGALVGLCDGVDADLGEAVQVARAAFGAEGFEAAAITDAMVRGMPPPDRVEPVRYAEVRFDRPYAVVALADVQRDTPGAPAPAWAAVPVFAAWVAESIEA